jgi:hypothetical protein
VKTLVALIGGSALGIFLLCNVFVVVLGVQASPTRPPSQIASTIWVGFRPAYQTGQWLVTAGHAVGSFAQAHQLSPPAPPAPPVHHQFRVVTHATPGPKGTASYGFGSCIVYNANGATTQDISAPAATEPPTYGQAFFDGDRISCTLQEGYVNSPGTVTLEVFDLGSSGSQTLLETSTSSTTAAVATVLPAGES